VKFLQTGAQLKLQPANTTAYFLAHFVDTYLGPAFGMFEIFGRIGPPILGGRQFWHPLFNVTAPSRVQTPSKTHKFTQQAWRAKML